MHASDIVGKTKHMSLAKHSVVRKNSLRKNQFQHHPHTVSIPPQKGWVGRLRGRAVCITKIEQKQEHTRNEKVGRVMGREHSHLERELPQAAKRSLKKTTTSTKHGFRSRPNVDHP